MAYFEPKTKEILLTQEEKKMFKEFDVNIASKRTPVSNNIIRWILTDNKNTNYEAKN